MSIKNPYPRKNPMAISATAHYTPVTFRAHTSCCIHANDKTLYMVRQVFFYEHIVHILSTGASHTAPKRNQEQLRRNEQERLTSLTHFRFIFDLFFISCGFLGSSNVNMPVA
jgi:hypothetical protein